MEAGHRQKSMVIILKKKFVLPHPSFGCQEFYLVDKLARPGYDHIRQLLILVVPVIDVGQRDDHQEGHQVLGIKNKMLLFNQICYVPGDQAAHLLLLNALQIGLEAVVCCSLGFQINLYLADLFGDDIYDVVMASKV